MRRSIHAILVLAFCLPSCNDPKTSINDPGSQTTGTTDPEPFRWRYAPPESQNMSSEKLDALVKDLAARGTKKLMIIRNDTVVCNWFAEGYEDSIRGHYTASLAKSIVSGMSLLTAMEDGLLYPDEASCRFIPEWKDDYVKSKITLRQLAGHTSGIEDAEVSAEEAAEMISKGLHIHMDLPGWKGQFWRKDPDPFSVSRDSAPVIYSPGQKYMYSNAGIAMLNYAVTAAIAGSDHKDIRTYLQERIYRPIGIEDNEYSVGYGTTYTLEGLPLVAGWGGGAFTANAVARIGRLMLHLGNWQGRQLIDSSLVAEAVRFEISNNKEYSADREHSDNPFLATTLGWYNNHDGIWPYLPRDAYAGSGAQNQLLLVIPSLDLIVVRFGDQLTDAFEGRNLRQAAITHLFNPVMEAIEAPPYPQSDLITAAEFAPAETVIRLAQGSDNWPATWAGDDHLYTAYGDGNGFLPRTEIKLSLGISRISGFPPDIQGTNIRTRTGERVGDGKYGPKASGMLMVDGTLYMLVRNVGNSQLAWSSDNGISWEWADWKFTTGLGCPTFLNFGKDYEGARDQYVYLYATDEGSAYKAGDHMNLARVHKKQIKNLEGYQFFAGFGKNQKPCWSENFNLRKPIFSNPGRCYRSGISYNPGLKRYLWCQIIPTSSNDGQKGPRFHGGLGIFEAPEPWGPWKTVYYTLNWDMGPGETASLPPKWMSQDGQTCYYLFSGDDCFSVRKVTFTTD